MGNRRLFLARAAKSESFGPELQLPEETREKERGTKNMEYFFSSIFLPLSRFPRSCDRACHVRA